MANEGNPRREFEGKAHTLSGSLIGKPVKPRQMDFKRAGGQARPGNAPTPVGGERFAGPGGYLGEGAEGKAAAPAPAALAAPAPAAPALGHHHKEYDIVLKAVRPNGQEVVLRFRAKIPTDSKITELNAWEAK